MTHLPRVLAKIAIGLAALLVSCGGSTNVGTGNPWDGTRTSIYVLRGEAPIAFTGPDASDPLVTAQIGQALENRTIELDLFEVENEGGHVQQMKLHNADILSYLFAGGQAFEMPGSVSPAAEDWTLINLHLAGPTYAWQTLECNGGFDGLTVETMVQRLHPIRTYNAVAPIPVDITWRITGLNGSRLVEVDCLQRAWIYVLSSTV